MNLIDLTSENFRQTYQNNDIVVVDFWALWCGPCHAFAPIYAEVASRYPSLVFGKINSEEQPDLADYFAIRSIPTVLIIREGLELFRHSGLISSNDLTTVIEQVINADMAQIRQQIEEEDGHISPKV